MKEFVSSQLNMMIVSLLLGAAMGFLYDLIRCFRRLISHNNFFIALSDLIFWLFSACVTIACINKYNSGSLRWYVILGMFLGFVVYHFTVSAVFMFLAGYAIKFIRKICKKFNEVLKKRLKWFRIMSTMSKKSKET